MADFRNTFLSLENDADNLRQLFGAMSRRTRVASIDTDLALEKLRRMYEVVRLLPQQQGSEPATAPEFSPIAHVPIPEKHAEPTPAEGTMLSDTQAEHIAETPPPPLSAQVKAAEYSEKPAAAAKPAQTLSDKLSDNKMPLYEHISQSADKKPLGNTLVGKPIKSLTAAIGINDRFRFAQELCHGKVDEFLQALKALDNCESFSQASDYLNTQLGWDTKHEAGAGIVNLLKRRWND